MADPSAVSRGHQSADERYLPVIVIASGLVLFMAIAAVVGLWVLSAGARPDTVPALGHPTRDRIEEFPAPRLQSTPGADMAELRKDEHELLTRYQWIDREAGTARIPIDRAIEILIERGLPVRKK